MINGTCSAMHSLTCNLIGNLQCFHGHKYQISKIMGLFNITKVYTSK